MSPEIVSTQSNDQESLETQEIHSATVEYLIERGWQILLFWLEENAPVGINKLAYDVNLFEYYQRVANKNAGCVTKELNEVAPSTLLDFVNRVGALGKW